MATTSPTTAAVSVATTTSATAGPPKDVCDILTSADVGSVARRGPAGKANRVQKPDHSTDTCEWGDFTRGGLLVTISTYNDAAVLAAAKTQLTATGARPLAGVGDSAFQQGDGVTVFHGTTVIGVYSNGGNADVLVNLATKVLAAQR